jgi:hypothetical protein
LIAANPEAGGALTDAKPEDVVVEASYHSLMMWFEEYCQLVKQLPR